MSGARSTLPPCTSARPATPASRQGITPHEVAKMDPKQAKFFLHDLIWHFEKKGMKGSGIEGCVKAVKSWMVWNDIDPPKSNRIYGASDYNKYENEVPPTRQELRRILDVAGPNLFITYPLVRLDKFVIGLFVICLLSTTLQGL